MNSNSLEVQDITLYSLIDDNISTPSVNAPFQARISLKEHSPQSDNGIIILEPDWAVAVNGNSVSMKTHPAAVVKNKKMRIMVRFFSAPPANVIINGYSSLGGNFKLISLNNNIATFESAVPVSNCVKIVNDTSMILYNNGVILVKSQIPKIFIIREYLDEPCFWQIVEYTCKWLENLTPFQLDDEQNVIDAIWTGCNKNNLASMGYQYVYDLQNPSPNSVNQILCNKKSSCGGWTDFFIHCLYCQGIRNIFDGNNPVPKTQKVHNSIIKILDFYIPNDGDINTKRFKYNDKYSSIGNKPPNVYFQDHNFVGYGGNFVKEKINTNGKDKEVYVYKGGTIFDIVYGIKLNNVNYLSYENEAIGYIKENKDAPEIAKGKERQFVVKCITINGNDELVWWPICGGE